MTPIAQSPSTLQSLMQEVISIARRAGDMIRTEQAGFDKAQIEMKGHHDYVSYADRKVEEFIVSQLTPLVPGAHFLTEEKTQKDKSQDETSTYTWIIDPIDGTTNFIHNMSPCCVSIALRNDHEILIGVVYEIGLDECFYSCKGDKAYLNGQEIHASSCTDSNHAFIELGLPYMSAKEPCLPEYLIKNLYGKIGGMRLLGACAAELCYVAAGRFEARIEENLGVWDVAAGGFILMQAGGRVTTFYNESSDINDEDSWLDAKQLLATNGHMHEFIRTCIQEVR